EVIKLKQDNQDQVNAITKDYQTKMESIKTETEHTINTLSTNNQRLRIQVTRSESTGTCSTANSSGQQSYEYAELSKGSSEFLVSQAIKADQWIIHLQEVITTLTKENSELKK
ncbi:lysis system i-spanin subunit Rz, partial [Tatumella sp. JGM94]